jgi:hypothetical protein
MAVSDALYGPTQRYVSHQRLEAMLQYELDQLIQQLGPRRGDTTTRPERPAASCRHATARSAE